MPDVIQGCRHTSAQSANTSLVKINIPIIAQNVAFVGKRERDCSKIEKRIDKYEIFICHEHRTKKNSASPTAIKPMIVVVINQ